MSQSIGYWSISSQVLKEEAEKLWLEVEVIIPEKNLFFVRSSTKEVLFKSTDFGLSSSLGEKITDDKELTYALLTRYGIPIPKTLYIDTTEFSWYDWNKFSDFRFPVIIKPLDGAHGNGVCMNILSKQELQEKLKTSFDSYPRMIVQEEISWDECRVLVVLWDVITAYNRIPPSVLWDGISTIWDLIEYENSSNPLRQEAYNAALSFIKVDGELTSYIEKQGFGLGKILPAWQRLQLRGNSNVGTWATIQEVTDILHPETKKLCIDVAEKLWLGICWVDVLTTDFSKPLSETWGVILEVNGTPGIGGDRELSSVNSGRVILEKLFF